MTRVNAVRGRILLALVIAAAAACTAKEVPYADEIAAWHAEKDQYLREADSSPVPKDRRATFPALAYFPIEPEYRVPAALEVARGNDVIEIPTSNGERRKHNRVGTLRFTLKGQELALTAFVEVGQQDLRRLFVPFGDLTNGTETYPGGRYLELDRTSTNVYDLDFNRGFHPFCYYNPEYDCPYPPRENRLPLPVRAGEKLGPAGYKG